MARKNKKKHMKQDNERVCFQNAKRMKITKTILIFGIGILIISCNPLTQIPKHETVCDSIEISASEYLVGATLWFQKSAEMRAVYYQSYRYAELALENQLNKLEDKTKTAVVLDIDETVLDNSPYEGMLIQKSLRYSPETWKEWTNLAKAKALPGVVEFTHYAKAKGVEVFYVSNRSIDEREATIKNMINEKLPDADERHIFLKTDESSKMPRYEIIAKEYNILLFVGDNLRDFDENFANRHENYGFALVDSLKNQFGEKYIILPNPVYGEWEKAIYQGKSPNAKESNRLRKQAIHSY